MREMMTGKKKKVAGKHGHRKKLPIQSIRRIENKKLKVAQRNCNLMSKRRADSAKRIKAKVEQS